MKTYLFDTFNRYKRFSENLDVTTVLCNKSWWVFNDSGEKEIYIFQTDGSLIISYSGKVTYATWQYIPANKSLIITAKEQAYMLHPTFRDNVIFVLQVDGTEQYSFMIDESQNKSFQPASFKELQIYFQKKEIEEQKKIETERQQLLLSEHEHALQKQKRHLENVARLNRMDKIAGRKWIWELQEEKILEKDYKYQRLLRKKRKWQIYLWGTLTVSIINAYIAQYYPVMQQPWWIWAINFPCFVICSTSFLYIVFYYFLSGIGKAPAIYKKQLKKDFINNV